MSASIAIQVLPDATDNAQLCQRVDAVIAYIQSTGLPYQVGAFETTIEGEDYNQLMDIAKNCQLVAIEAGAQKVSAYIKVVYQPQGDLLSIEDKVGKYQRGCDKI